MTSTMLMTLFGQVFPERGVKPGSADYHAFAAAAAYAVLALPLGTAIGGERVTAVGFDISCRVAAVEYVFGRDMDERGVVPAGRPCEVAGAGGVDGTAERLVALSPVDVGIGGTVDDGAHFVLRDKSADLAGVADIEPENPAVLPYVGEDEFGSACRKQLKFCAELAESTGDQYFFHPLKICTKI